MKALKTVMSRFRKNQQEAPGLIMFAGFSFLASGAQLWAKGWFWFPIFLCVTGVFFVIDTLVKKTGAHISS